MPDVIAKGTWRALNPGEEEDLQGVKITYDSPIQEVLVDSTELTDTDRSVDEEWEKFPVFADWEFAEANFKDDLRSPYEQVYGSS